MWEVSQTGEDSIFVSAYLVTRTSMDSDSGIDGFHPCTPPFESFIAVILVFIIYLLYSIHNPKRDRPI